LQHSHLPLYFFFLLFPKESNPKHSNFFFTFYITSIIFYYYSNKKTHSKTKLFHFSIKQFQIFLYFISHQSLLITIQTKILQHNHLPNTPYATFQIHHKINSQKFDFAPAGNRTRVCTVAGYYSTTRPLVLFVVKQDQVIKNTIKIPLPLTHSGSKRSPLARCNWAGEYQVA